MTFGGDVERAVPETSRSCCAGVELAKTPTPRNIHGVGVGPQAVVPDLSDVSTRSPSQVFTTQRPSSQDVFGLALLGLNGHLLDEASDISTEKAGSHVAEEAAVWDSDLEDEEAVQGQVMEMMSARKFLANSNTAGGRPGELLRGSHRHGERHPADEAVVCELDLDEARDTVPRPRQRVVCCAESFACYSRTSSGIPSPAPASWSVTEHLREPRSSLQAVWDWARASAEGIWNSDPVPHAACGGSQSLEPCEHSLNRADSLQDRKSVV